MKEIKYRTFCDETTKGKTFDSKVPDWELNEETGLPEKTGGFTDVDLLAASCYESCLDFILNRFLEGEDVDIPCPAENDFNQDFLADKLDTIMEYTNIKTEAIEKYNLPLDADDKVIADCLQKVYDGLKGEKKNEKEIVPEKVQENLSEHGSQDSQAESQA